MPSRTGKDNQPKEDESPDLPAVPTKSASDEVQKMSEDEPDSVDDSTEKAKMSDVKDDSTKKTQEMSGEESDTMDVSTDKGKMSDVEDDSTKKAKEMSGEESDTMDVSTEKAKQSVTGDSTEKVKKMSDVKEESATKEAPEKSDANEDSSENTQMPAGDDSLGEAQKKSEEESEATADESTEDVLLNTTSLDVRILLIPIGKNKVGDLYFWQPSYPAFLSPPKHVANGSLKWHQKEESGKELLIDAFLAMSDDYSFLHAVVNESGSAEESPKQRVVWRRPTSQLVPSSGSSEGTMVWQARTTLRHSADLSFQAHDLEQRRSVLLVPFNPDVHIHGESAPGCEEGSLSGNRSPQTAEASSEAESSDDVYAGSTPKKPRLN